MKFRNFIQTIAVSVAFLMFGIYFQKHQKALEEIRCYNAEQEALSAQINKLREESEMLEMCWARCSDRAMKYEAEAEYYRAILEGKHKSEVCDAVR